VSLILHYYTDDNLFKAWIFTIVGLVLLWIILEVVYRSQTRSIIYRIFFRHHNKHENYHQKILQNLIDKKEIFEDYANKGVRYVIVDNSMYFIDEDFMHPGGEYIFNILNGKEINYYLKGAKSIAVNYPRHAHTKYVTKYL